MISSLISAEQILFLFNTKKVELSELKESWKDQVTMIYLWDLRVLQLICKMKENKSELYHLKDDEVLCQHEQIVLSDSNKLKLQTLQKLYDASLTDHYEIKRIKNLVRWHYVFKKMKQFIINYVFTCKICRKSKSAQKVSEEKLKSLSVSQESWVSLSMNFIVKLSKFRWNVKKYDFIMMIVNWLIKMTHFVPCNRIMNVSELVTLFIREVIRLHEISQNVVTD